MTVPAVARAARAADAVHPLDLIALTDILDQRRRARADQIEALLLSPEDRSRELAAAQAVLDELDVALGCVRDRKGLKASS